MSRFFAGGSESDSDSSSDSEPIQRQTAPQFTFSDEEEDVKRVVRSTKEKRYEDLSNIIKSIRNYKKIKDMSSLLSSFEDLTRAYAKALPVITKEENGVCPRFIIRALAELEDFINEVWDDREGRKNLSKNNSKSLGALRQKFRKYIKDFDSDLKKFRESPDAADDEDEEEEKKEEEESDDEEAAVVPAAKAVSFKKDTVEKVKVEKDDDDSDDSIDWGQDSDSDESSSEEEAYGANIRERFLKRPEKEDGDDGEKKKEKKKTKETKDSRKKKRVEDDDDEGWESSATSEKPKMFAKDAEIDVALVVNKLNEVMAARGKKRTDRKLQIEFLRELRAISEEKKLGAAVAAKIRFNIVSAIFDYNPKVSEPMKLEHWSKLLEEIQALIKLLLANEDIVLSENILDENEEYDTAPYKIRGCMLTAVERLDDEFTKLLKECDPHSNEYVDRLKDEVTVTNVIEQVVQYVERLGNEMETCRIYLRKIDHLYYKFDPNVLKKRKAQLPASSLTSVDEMERLCRFIYAKDQTDRLRTRAILSHIFHHALHDNWFQARDLVLMSHLQETIHHSDPPTQILYNRTMANLGLCAFRHGNIKDAHQCLVDLMMTGKPKELLAQGLVPQRQNERSLEQEKVEKQRQMPFHMHINLELLECVYLVSAMLLEIPYMAAHEFDARRRMISKTFYQQLRSSERQSLVGPPESMREHVVAAAKAMRHGDWQACSNFIVNKKMNVKVWDLFYEADRVREMLAKFIKEEALRTYLFTYSNVYASISVPYLAEMFDLPKSKVHSLISKMIINEELMASLDDPTETVVLHRSEPSRLQALSMQLADKVTNLVDSNERVFEMKQGNFFQRGGNQGYNRDRQNYRNQNQNRENWNNNRRQDRGNRNRNQNRDREQREQHRVEFEEKAE
ncbi:eukaryotic translation initiation factor 3 subunit 8 [Culex quinquefasciatus]|uniref:Eukaryotic translation initiation factor 3 subunit C n=1 Tax=Culex quinquefasciatus TaxID=7176 RepID=EIF3C_CULQU|nr:RecName: Full=Eukaryotic translation initiation factor 3 subunit C; Short=eIF3c; AltName: Full=Eukaryotic translation initiation factor 3 subunit 8 [Culex quinquefasciatus]EDS41375.1 eukaryotic translation initiation factor 3 subunit 8 [Culex quinquefasciatus]|eukprot:XP_001842307.1 eukaryotic translation initiation factor 3 subunit 8 [Culex quinquefasciatus]